MCMQHQVATLIDSLPHLFDVALLSAFILVISQQCISMLKMAILGGLQLATTAFSEGDTGLRAALHTPEEPPSHRARSQRLWCPL